MNWEYIDSHTLPWADGKVMIGIIGRRDDGEYFYKSKTIKADAGENTRSAVVAEVRASLDEYLGPAGDEAIIARKAGK